MNEQPLPQTPEQQHAYDMIAKTNISFFLTGRAGTGKSTFLRKVQEVNNKNFVVLAPTGVAAMSVGGQTIHSFFGFPFGVLCPGDLGTLNENKISLVRHLDTIIVDEVSMTRCDIIDAMDRTLRFYRRSAAPFGGIQMIFVGDMFQLEPVVTPQDSDILAEFYGKGPYYFYRAAAVERLRMPKIEFTKIYRQTDPLFINILENIRTGRTTWQDFQRINSRVQIPGEGSTKLKVVLTTTRRNAQAINEARLDQLTTTPMLYDAEYQGEPKKDDDIALAQLVLKEGAQVMFTRNDASHRWVNGTIGTVDKLTETSISVRLESNECYDVSKEQWENIEYEYDKETKSCKKNVKGITTQYPLRLAWAITIHKSQSLTFDRVAVDFGQKAFCCGQAYVALSRVRSLDGLELLRPMTPSSVIVSRDVLRFSENVNDEEVISRELTVGEAVLDFVRKQDYDSAARRLFGMCQEAALEHDLTTACDLIRRTMSYIADDACLMGSAWVPTRDTTYQGRVLDAIGLYYSGSKDQAENILEEMRVAISRDIDALYILSRCKEDRRDWVGVEAVYGTMLQLYEELRDRGLDDEAFRKVRYRLAILNELVYKKPGAGLMRQLIYENPSYGRYYTAIRWMLASSQEAREEADDVIESPLVAMIFNSDSQNEQFAESVLEARDKHDDSWKEFRRYLSNLKLAMPY